MLLSNSANSEITIRTQSRMRKIRSKMLLYFRTLFQLVMMVLGVRRVRSNLEKRNLTPESLV